MKYFPFCPFVAFCLFVPLIFFSLFSWSVVLFKHFLIKFNYYTCLLQFLLFRLPLLINNPIRNLYRYSYIYIYKYLKDKINKIYIYTNNGFWYVNYSYLRRSYLLSVYLLSLMFHRYLTNPTSVCLFFLLLLFLFSPSFFMWFDYNIWLLPFPYFYKEIRVLYKWYFNMFIQWLSFPSFT